MNQISIGPETRPLSDADPDWIAQQVNRRQADGQSVCVRVVLKEGGLDMVLSTPTCGGGGGGGGRRPRPAEQEIFDLWNKLGLNQGDFSGGNLVAFVKQLQKAIA